MNRSNNKIDEKLAAPNTPLEDLLQEEEIIPIKKQIQEMMK